MDATIACIDCREQRTVRLRYKHPVSLRCRSCANKHNANSRKNPIGNKSSSWKGGRHIDKAGYTWLYLEPGDYYHSMVSSNGYIREHRLVMARQLGRCLQPWETIHHKNGHRSDNSIENLELSTHGSHALSHSKGYKDGYTKGLQDAKDKRISELQHRITLLEAEMSLLKTRFAVIPL